MNDPVVNDEARHDRECQKQEALMEQARALAQTAYEAGELDDWIQDEVDPHDSFRLAHSVVQWRKQIGNIPMGLSDDAYGTEVIELSKELIAWLPSMSITDFEINMEHVIEKKALMILEDL